MQILGQLKVAVAAVDAAVRASSACCLAILSSEYVLSSAALAAGSKLAETGRGTLGTGAGTGDPGGVAAGAIPPGDGGGTSETATCDPVGSVMDLRRSFFMASDLFL